MKTAAVLFIALIATAVLIAGCSQEQKTAGTQESGNAAGNTAGNVAGDASAAQIEDTFDQGFDTPDTTASAANEIDPDDLTY